MALVSDAFCGGIVLHTPTTGPYKDEVVITRGCLITWVRKSGGFICNLSVHKDQPGEAPATIAQLYYTLVKKDSFPNFPFPKGPCFQGNTYQCLKDACSLDGRKQYFLAAPPVLFPVKYGVPGIPVGPKSDDTDAFLSATHPSARAWLQLGSDHTDLMGQTIADNLDELKDVLPPTAGCTVLTTPSAKFDTMDSVEQETIYKSQCDKLSATLASLLKSPTPTVIDVGSSQHPTTSVASGGGGDDVSVLTTTPAAKDNSIKKGKYREASHKLLHGRFALQSDGTMQFVQATLREVVEECLTATSETFGARQYGDLFSQKQDELQKTRDYHSKRIKCPGVGKSQGAQLLVYHVKGTKTKRLLTFPKMKASFTGITCLSFLPDSEGIEAKRQQISADDIRYFEEMYGTDEKHRTKLSTELVLVTNVTSLAQVQVLLANFTLWCAVDVDFDVTICDESSPLLHYFAYQLADVLSDYEFIEWYNALDEKSRGAFLHWTLERCEFVLQSCLAFASSTTSVSGVLNNRHSDLKSAEHSAIVDYITNNLSTIHRWLEAGTTVIDPGHLYKSSVHYERVMAREKKQADAASADRLSSQQGRQKRLK